VFTPTAHDSDLPAHTLAWSASSSGPAGMNLDPVTGAISWTPDESQGGQSFPVTVTVTDNGTPPLSDTKTFTIS